MLYNYLHTILRNLRKQSLLSTIKILSLTLGMVCSILVIMHVQFNYSFDKHIPNWENIYRVTTSYSTNQRIETGQSSPAYAAALERDYSQIELIAKVRPFGGRFSTGGESLSNAFFFVQPEILKIFSIEFIAGDSESALDGINSIIVDESTAAKYFGESDPIGRTLTFNDENDLMVTGVIRDLPKNTHINLGMMVSVETGQQLYGETFMNFDSWSGFDGTITYLTLPNRLEAVAINNDLDEFVSRNAPEQQLARLQQQLDLSLWLEPLSDIYLSRFSWAGGDPNRVRILYGLSLFAILILATSTINFANLSLTQARERAKEIGIRKTLGANPSDLIFQFLFEAIILTGLAVIIALPIIYLVTPAYTNLTSTEFQFSHILETEYTVSVVSFVLLLGITAGLYPALSLSRYQPVTAIRELVMTNRLKNLFRKAITVGQFSISIVLVILAVVIGFQIAHLNVMDIGLNRSNLVILDSTSSYNNPEEFDYDALVNDLQQHSSILAVAKSSVPPPSTGGYNPWSLPEWSGERQIPISHYVVDENYVNTLEFELLAGRTFTRDFPADFLPIDVSNPERIYGAIITRSAVTNFGFDSVDSAVGEIILYRDVPHRVIGVIENFRLSGGLEDVLRSTSVLRGTLDPLRVLNIRINPDQSEAALEYIDTVWRNHRPDVPVDRRFYDQVFSDLIFSRTNGIRTASLIASVVTIAIAALGLYSLAFYATRRRIKEIGMRKVLGATSRSIVALLTWEFIKPVLVSCFISWGISYIVIDYFLSQFSSSASVGLINYLAIFSGTIIVAIGTVATQCLKSANSNPIESLRFE